MWILSNESHIKSCKLILIKHLMCTSELSFSMQVLNRKATRVQNTRGTKSWIDFSKFASVVFIVIWLRANQRLLLSKVAFLSNKSKSSFILLYAINIHTYIQTEPTTYSLLRGENNGVISKKIQS